MQKAIANNKTKKQIALLISLIPSNSIRICLYKWLLKYQIDSSAKIGYLTIIAVEKVEIEKQVNIGRGNLFFGSFKLKMGQGAIVGNKNEFICDDWALDTRFDNCGFVRECKIGKNTLITHGHFIDLVGEFELQDNSWIGGRNSQFWTHGGWVNKNSISIGKNCYLGSAVKFIPGTKIGDNIIVGLGSVVTKEFNINNALIAGVPAKVIKQNYDWKTKTHLEKLMDLKNLKIPLVTETLKNVEVERINDVVPNLLS